MRLRNLIPCQAKLILYKTAIMPHITHCHLVWNFCKSSDGRKMERIQERALRAVFKTTTETYKELLKVAEHSCCACSCWCDSEREQALQKQTCRWNSDHFFVLNARSIFAIFLRNWTQCVDDLSLLWQRYVRKGNAAKNPGILGFFNIEKNPVKCSACAVARKIETDCFSRKLPNFYDPVVKISKTFGNKIVQKPSKWSITKKSEFWHWEFSIIQKTIYGEFGQLGKSRMSKFY